MNTRFHEKIVFKGNSLIFPHKLNFRLRAGKNLSRADRTKRAGVFLNIPKFEFRAGESEEGTPKPLPTTQKVHCCL
jgi:hypothetical protein